MIKKNYLATFAKSFNWAWFFLPKNTYEECSKLYAFCRILDDVADSGQDLEIKKKKFNEIKDIIKLYEIRFTDNQDMLVVNDMIVLSKNKIKLWNISISPTICVISIKPSLILAISLYSLNLDMLNINLYVKDDGYNEKISEI